MIIVKRKLREDEVYMLHSFVQGKFGIEAVCINKEGHVLCFDRQNIIVPDQPLLKEINRMNDYMKK